MDKAQWAQLSPLLDELLDLDGPARAQRLSQMRAQDAASAAAVETLLGHLPVIERDNFLEKPPSLGEDSLAGQVIGPYTVEREIGQGGMGSVWLARRTDGRYEGSVAIKFLNAGLQGRGAAERFAREGSILARLAHPNIARLIDAGVARAGQPYLVLEYIDGETIDRYCDTHRLDVTARVRLFLDVLAAVAHAHNRLILHRDLKPSNILVTHAGEVKLLDFGIAKLMDDATVPAPVTELTQLAGRAFTPQYAAPEQLQGGDVTTATDVYALGVLLYGLLSGAHPTSVSPSGPLDQMRAVIETEPRRLSEAAARRHDDAAAGARLARELRGDLDNIVAKALKKAPAQRYANAAQLAEDLQRYLAHEPVTARPDGAAYRVAKFVRRHRLGVAAGGITAAALAVGVSATLWQAREARLQRVQAEGLIEFMLGDLRKKLQPVGRLDVLDAVGEKTLAYYAAQDAGAMDADALGRRARALHLIGEIHEKRGRLDDALDAFRKAEETTAQLVARTPADGQRVFDHAQSVYWVGYIAWRRGQTQQAETSFRRYVELAQRLTRLDPSNPDWRLETAYAGQNLGVVYLDSARPAQALASFVEARTALLALVGARPELHFDLAVAHGWIAKAREALGDFEAALAAQQTKAEALRKVPDAARNREVQRMLADGDYEQGRLQLALGRGASALAPARAAVEQLQALLAVDPSNLYWLEQACFARQSLAEIEFALGDVDSARTDLERSAAEMERLVATDAMQTKWHINLRGRILSLLGALQLAQGRLLPTGPLQAYLERVKQLEHEGKRLNAVQTGIVAGAEMVLGDALSRAGRQDEALARWSDARQRSQALAEGDYMPGITLLARAEARLGHTGSARALAERVRASKYRHPDYVALVQELSHDAGAGQP
ncbi:MAG TPA: protein kinase [Albitalea sp.]|nr:protein kinase [Albitalea sp.]